MPRNCSHADEAFKARKLALQKRLMAEGRWAEAGRFKEEVRKDLKNHKIGNKHMTADEIVLAAWDAMEKTYPPLKPGEIVERPLVEETEVEPSPSAPDPVNTVVVPILRTEPEKRERAKAIHIPVSWGDLPPTAKWEDEVDWVHQNLMRCLEERKEGNTMNLLKARTPAPSEGAVALMKFAVSNQNAFQKDIVLKAKKGEEGGDPEMVRVEKRSVQEVRDILEQMEATG